MVTYAPLGYYVPLGTGRYLGEGTAREQILGGIEIDWPNHGWHSTGHNEWRFLVPGGFESSRGRESYIRADGKGLTQIDVGSCNLLLDNSDGRYDARNTASELYPYLLNNEPRMARVWVKDGDSGNQYNIITGSMVDFTPVNDSRGRKYLRVAIEDGMNRLHGDKVYIDLTAGLGTEEIIAAVLNNISYPWGQDLETGVESVLYFWAYGVSPYETIMNVAESELGNFFIAADGDASFRTRLNTDAAPLTLSGSEISPELEDSQPAETLKDRVVITVHPRILQSTADVWVLQDVPVSIENGTSKTFWPEFTYDNRPVPVDNPVTPVGATDFEANAQSDGLGVDLTAGFTASFTAFGSGGKLIITNNSGSDGYLINLKMRADALDSPDAVRVESGTGSHVLSIDLPWIQSVNSAQDTADAAYNALSNPSKFYLTISLEGNFEKQFSRDLFRWVELSLASKNLEDMFRITKIKHKLLKRRVFRTTFWLEPTVGLSGSGTTQLPFQLPAQYP